MSTSRRFFAILWRLTAVLGVVTLGGLCATSAFGATTNFAGSLNASGKVCVGSAACDASYSAGSYNLEVIDTSPTIALLNGKEIPFPTVAWELKADSNTGFTITDQATGR